MNAPANMLRADSAKVVPHASHAGLEALGRPRALPLPRARPTQIWSDGLGPRMPRHRPVVLRTNRRPVTPEHVGTACLHKSLPSNRVAHHWSASTAETTLDNT